MSREQNELKPCPFCGGKAEVEKPALMDDGRYWESSVECGDCGVKSVGDCSYQKDGSVATNEAIKIWNTRQAATESQGYSEWPVEHASHDEAATLLMRDITEQLPCDPSDELAVTVNYNWLYERVRQAFESCKPTDSQGAEPAMYVNESQIRSAKRLRDKGIQVGSVAFPMPEEYHCPVPLYAHPPAPTVPGIVREALRLAEPLCRAWYKQGRGGGYEAYVAVKKAAALLAESKRGPADG